MENLVLDFVQCHKSRGCITTDNREGQGHAAEELGSQLRPSTYPHTIFHRCRKDNSGIVIYREGFFCLLNTYTDFFTFSFLC